MELSEIIKSVRGTKTQLQFAQELGVSRQSVNQWETGNTKPTDEQLDKMGIQTQFTRNHGIGQLTPEQVEEAVYPSREALRAICANGPLISGGDYCYKHSKSLLDGPCPQCSLSERISCKHKELCEDGEYYSCALEAGHKGKCIRGNRIEV